MAFDGGAVVRGKDICTAATFAATRVEIAPPGSAKFTPPCSRGRQTRRCKGSRRRCRALRAVCRRGLGGQHQHAGPAGVGGWKRSYPRGRQTRRCKGYGGDAARCGRYAGEGVGGQHQHGGPAGIGGWKRSYPREWRRCAPLRAHSLAPILGGRPQQRSHIPALCRDYTIFSRRLQPPALQPHGNQF